MCSTVASHSATVISADLGKVTARSRSAASRNLRAPIPKPVAFSTPRRQSEVAVIDTKTHTVHESLPIAPGEGASGMAIDVKNHRLFLGCDNKLMVMMDSTNGKVLASVPIGEGVDGAAFDPETKLAFASCGDSTTTIAREDGDKLTVVQTLATRRARGR